MTNIEQAGDTAVEADILGQDTGEVSYIISIPEKIDLIKKMLLKKDQNEVDVTLVQDGKLSLKPTGDIGYRYKKMLYFVLIHLLQLVLSPMLMNTTFLVQIYQNILLLLIPLFYLD